MVDAVASYLQTVVVHPIQTGPRVSQSKYAEHGTSGHRENCIQHTQNNRHSTDGSHYIGARWTKQNKKSKRRRKKSTKHVRVPDRDVKKRSLVQVLGRNRSCGERRNCRYTSDGLISSCRSPKTLSSPLNFKTSFCHPSASIFFFSFETLSCFGLAGSARIRGVEELGQKNFLFLSFKETLLVMSPPQHRIPSHSHRTPMKKKQNTSQATWREGERLCGVLLFGFSCFFSLSPRENSRWLFFAVAFYSAAVALRSYTFSLSCSPSQK